MSLPEPKTPRWQLAELHCYIYTSSRNGKEQNDHEEHICELDSQVTTPSQMNPFCKVCRGASSLCSLGKATNFHAHARVGRWAALTRLSISSDMKSSCGQHADMSQQKRPYLKEDITV